MKTIITQHLTNDEKSIREEVFMEEQGFTEEFDAIDDIATHLVLYNADQAIGCCRLFSGEISDKYILGRLAVRKTQRGKSLGRAIVIEAEKYLQSKGIRMLALSAQLQAKGFYERMGYAASGSITYDEGCPHVYMEKELMG
jgi:Predicted acyltransferase